MIKTLLVFQKIEVKQRGRVRRARLYYLRNLRGKAARITQQRNVVATTVATTEERSAAAE